MDTWQDRAYAQFMASFLQSKLRGGDNLVRVELVNDTENQFFDMTYIDWVEIRYQRELVAVETCSLFQSPAPGSWIYLVSGFSNQEVELYDVTEPVVYSD